jgi:hypothetical protein
MLQVKHSHVRNYLQMRSREQCCFSFVSKLNVASTGTANYASQAPRPAPTTRGKMRIDQLRVGIT